MRAPYACSHVIGELSLIYFLGLSNRLTRLSHLGWVSLRQSGWLG